MWRFTFVALLSSLCVSQSLLASSVAVATNPVGLTIQVDGITTTAPQSFTWTTGSSHILAIVSPQQGGTSTRYVFSSWSDGGAQTHTVIASASDITYTVSFTTQYLLTVTASPPGSGTFSFYPPSPDGYYNAVTSPPPYLVSIFPNAAPGYLWHTWSGDVGGPFTFFIDPMIQVPMDHPRNVVGAFIRPIPITLSRASLNFGISSDHLLVTSPQTVNTSFSATTPVNWTAQTNSPAFFVSPPAGVGAVSLQVTVTAIPTCPTFSPTFTPCDVTITATDTTVHRHSRCERLHGTRRYRHNRPVVRQFRHSTRQRREPFRVDRRDRLGVGFYRSHEGGPLARADFW